MGASTRPDHSVCSCGEIHPTDREFALQHDYPQQFDSPLAASCRAYSTALDGIVDAVWRSADRGFSAGADYLLVQTEDHQVFIVMYDRFTDGFYAKQEHGHDLDKLDPFAPAGYLQVASVASTVKDHRLALEVFYAPGCPPVLFTTRPMRKYDWQPAQHPGSLTIKTNSVLVSK